MRIGCEDKFWLVCNPHEHSRLEDICFETTLRSFEIQLRGGLSMDRSPTIFTDRREAKKEAKARLAAARVLRSLAERAASNGRPLRAALLDDNGQVVAEERIE